VTEEAAIPALAAGVKFRFDTVRQAWVILAPERLLLPDEQAVAILDLVDGARTLGAIIDALAARYDAPRDVIAGDVATMLQDLADKGVLRW
jgi:pyrroloquinoline quinone biosynthesis protein D